MQWASKG